MTIDQLKAFVAVVEAGSFRAAADLIHKTQPSISAAVQTLEQQFNVSLLDRNSYRPTLTTEGHHFFRQAKQLLSQAQHLENLGHDLAQQADTPLRLCLSSLCADTKALSFIQTFREQHPDIALDISSQHLHGVAEELQEGRAEIAITPRYGLDERHEFVELMQVEMVAVIAPSLMPKLDMVKNKVKQHALYQLPQVLVARSAVSIKNNENMNAMPMGKRWYVNDYQVKKSLLVGGQGWARMPRHMIYQELTSGDLVQIEVENFPSQSQVPIFLVRMRHQVLSSQANLFWQKLRDLSK